MQNNMQGVVYNIHENEAIAPGITIAVLTLKVRYLIASFVRFIPICITEELHACIAIVSNPYH